MINKNIRLEISGLGIVLYSDGAVKNINEGENFLQNEFLYAEQVINHLKKGDIIGFCTGTPGKFNIKFREGYPDKKINKDYPISINLAINVIGGKISIIDLYWLMEWNKNCPSNQQLQLEDGIYNIIVLTRKPKSKVWGDNQDIYIYLDKIIEMPKLNYIDIPIIFEE